MFHGGFVFGAKAPRVLVTLKGDAVVSHCWQVANAGIFDACLLSPCTLLVSVRWHLFTWCDFGDEPV